MKDQIYTQTKNPIHGLRCCWLNKFSMSVGVGESVFQLDIPFHSQFLAKSKKGKKWHKNGIFIVNNKNLFICNIYIKKVEEETETKHSNSNKNKNKNKRTKLEKVLPSHDEHANVMGIFDYDWKASRIPPVSSYKKKFHKCLC